jgi:hypothetical protein
MGYFYGGSTTLLHNSIITFCVQQPNSVVITDYCFSAADRYQQTAH